MLSYFARGKTYFDSTFNSRFLLPSRHPQESNLSCLEVELLPLENCAGAFGGPDSARQSCFEAQEDQPSSPPATSLEKISTPFV